MFWIYVCVCIDYCESVQPFFRLQPMEEPGTISEPDCLVIILINGKTFTQLTPPWSLTGGFMAGLKWCSDCSLTKWREVWVERAEECLLQFVLFSVFTCCLGRIFVSLWMGQFYRPGCYLLGTTRQLQIGSKKYFPKEGDSVLLSRKLHGCVHEITRNLILTKDWFKILYLCRQVIK